MVRVDRGLEIGGNARTALRRVAVMYEHGAFSPLELSEAARGVCDLIWVTGWAGPLDGPVARLLPRLGLVIDVQDLDREATVSALREARTGGIAIFTDAAQELAAELAQELGLPFHTPQTARWLCDKLEQRRRRASGAGRAGRQPIIHRHARAGRGA